MSKVAVFDFDGVLAPSNQIKIDAFVEVLPVAETKLRELMRKMYDPGETRYEMFAAVLEKCGTAKEKIPGLVAGYAEQYNNLVQEYIAKHGAAPGVADILKNLHWAGYHLYVYSNTPAEALRQTIKRLGIFELFTDVLGRPTSKADNLRQVIEREGVDAVSVMVVGDGESDWKSAREVGCGFIGLRSKFNGWTEAEKFPTINNIKELLEKISQ